MLHLGRSRVKGREVAWEGADTPSCIISGAPTIVPFSPGTFRGGLSGYTEKYSECWVEPLDLKHQSKSAASSWRVLSCGSPQPKENQEAKWPQCQCCADKCLQLALLTTHARTHTVSHVYCKSYWYKGSKAHNLLIMLKYSLLKNTF